jgi:hypothetical protein
MKTMVNLAVILLVAIAVVAFAAFFFMNKPNGSSDNQTDNSALTTIPNQTQNKNAVVTITYGKGATCPAGELYVDVHIKNDGYDSYTPSGSKFVLVIGDIYYHYDFSGSKLLGWQNVAIANGERYDASIAFKVPDSTAPFILNYDDTSTEYNIVCQPE